MFGEGHLINHAISGYRLFDLPCPNSFLIIHTKRSLDDLRGVTVGPCYLRHVADCESPCDLGSASLRLEYTDR